MKKVLVFAAMVAMLGVIGACNRGDGEAVNGPTVSYSSVGGSEPWFLAFSDEMKKEAKKRGYKFRVTYANSDVGKQIADVEDIVAQNPDFLLLGPVEREGSAKALQIAKKAGIPVVVVNRDVEGVAGEDYITKIYSDFEWIGAKMAESIHEAFEPDAEIKVVEMHGKSGGANTIGMSEGFRKKMKEYPNMEIVESQPGNFQQDVAMASMTNIIQGGTKFNAVFGHYDEDALGAIRAMQDQGMTVGSNPREGEIVVVGNGGTKAGLEAIKAGHYHKIVSVTPYYAAQVFDAIEKYENNEDQPDYIRVNDIIIDKSNVDEEMPNAF